MRTFSGQIIEICMHLLCDNIVLLIFLTMYRVPSPAKKSKPQTFVHIVIDRFSIFFTFFRKFVIEWLLNIPPNLNCSDYSAWVLKIYISHSRGSVATQLRCGGIFSNHFVRVKKFENRNIFGDNIDKNLRLTFLGPPCISQSHRTC